MRRLALKLFCVLLLCCSMPAWALTATVYIDPTCTNAGDGTVGSPCAASGGATGPYKAWSSVTWTAGNTYAGQGGTTANVCLAPNANGSAGSLITITSYGTGQHTIFCHGGTKPINIVLHSYITVSNLHITSDDANCVYLDRTDHIVISSNLIDRCHTTVGNGIVMEGQNATSSNSNITITGNTITGLASRCIYMSLVPTSNSSVFDAITISNNSCTGNATATVNSALEILLANGTTATVTNLTVSGNLVSNHNTGEGVSVGFAMRFARSGGTVHEDRFLGIRITGNTLTNSSQGISVNNTGTLAGVQNCVCNNTLSVIGGDAGISAFYTNDLLIQGNNISGVFPVTQGIDGIGIDVENSLASRPINTRVIGNLIQTNLGSQLPNSGEGIYLAICNDVEVVGNILIGNKENLYIDGGGTVPNVIANNTSIDATIDGIRTSTTQTQVNTITNNIVVGSAAYGINDVGISDQTLTTNLFFNNTLGNYNSIAAGATDLTSDPLLVNVYALASNSPARHAGTRLVECLDNAGHICANPPHIGAYQAGSGSPAITRSPITQPRAARQ